jgi:2-keto-3-deoxy-L-rhamnonate aldolase RhmA
MIESKKAIEAIDEIAAVDGVDALLVGSADLSVDLGAPGQLRSDTYRSAVESVSRACHRHGKILGVAGVYDNPEIRDWAINTLGARFMLVQQDAAILSSGSGERYRVSVGNQGVSVESVKASSARSHK